MTPRRLLPQGADMLSLWVQLFGSAQLAKVRSAVEAGTVLASGASPVIMGVLIDHHVTLRIQALICLAFIRAASLIATRVKKTAPGYKLLLKAPSVRLGAN